MLRDSRRFLVCWIAAAILLFRGGDALWQSARASHWPSIDAVVTESGSGWVAHHRAMYRPVWSYETQVRYIYAVHRRAYAGSQIRFSIWGPGEDFNPLMAKLLARYPAGTRTVARVDPAEPSRAVLDASPAASDWIAIMIGAALAAAGTRYARRAEAAKRAAAVTRV